MLRRWISHYCTSQQQNSGSGSSRSHRHDYLLSDEYPRDGYLRDGYLRDGYLRDGYLRDGYLRSKLASSSAMLEDTRDRTLLSRTVQF